ncbi:MAG: hypothetical protein ABIZ56_06185 [Chthoniobacteraceae bacterium]
MSCQPLSDGQRLDYAFFLAAQRRLAPAIMRARDSGLMVRFAPALPAGFDGALGLVGAGPPALRAAQRAFMDAASFARPSGVKPPFFFGAAAAFAAGEGEVPFIFAQRAREAAAIFARPSGDMVPRRRSPAGLGDAFAAGAWELPPMIEANSAWSFSICSEISRARLS